MNFVNSLPVDEMVSKKIKMKSFVITSWCRLPWYETDFGLGKPLWMWVTSAARNENIAILIDNINGNGIDAWVGLSKEEMVKFEQDPMIKKYASFDTGIWVGLWDMILCLRIFMFLPCVSLDMNLVENKAKYCLIYIYLTVSCHKNEISTGNKIYMHTYLVSAVDT